MADNVTTNAGSGGATFATDEIGGIQHTRVKVQFGSDGSATDASASDPLPVTTASLPLPSGASTEATLSTLNTKVPAQGQALMAASAPVVIASNQSAVPVSGTITADAGTGPWPVTDNGGSLTVDGTVTANATLAAETTKVIGTVNVAAAQTIAVTSDTAANAKVEPAGNVAHDAADSGNPLKVGAKAIASAAGLTMVATGDRTNVHADLDGAVLAKPIPNGDIISERIADTSGTSTAFTNFGAVAGARNYVRAIHVYNSSATDGFVDFRDGVAGAVLFTAAAPAGGGMTLACDTPLFRTSVNTALAYDVSAAITTVYINVSGHQSKA